MRAFFALKKYYWPCQTDWLIFKKDNPVANPSIREIEWSLWDTCVIWCLRVRKAALFDWVLWSQGLDLSMTLTNLTGKNYKRQKVRTATVGFWIKLSRNWIVIKLLKRKRILSIKSSQQIFREENNKKGSGGGKRK